MFEGLMFYSDLHATEYSFVVAIMIFVANGEYRQREFHVHVCPKKERLSLCKEVVVP